MTVVWMAVFTVLVWSAYRTLRFHPHAAVKVPSPDEGALMVAHRRLLHGEITAEDYERIADILHG